MTTESETEKPVETMDEKDRSNGTSSTAAAEVTTENEDSNENDEEAPRNGLKESNVVEGKRQRTPVKAFEAASASVTRKSRATPVANGNSNMEPLGMKVGDMKAVVEKLGRFASSDPELKFLHQIMYKRPGVKSHVKKGIREFDGIRYEITAERLSEKIGTQTLPFLKKIAQILMIKGDKPNASKDEVTLMLTNWFMKPEASEEAMIGSVTTPAANSEESPKKRGRPRKSDISVMDAAGEGDAVNDDSEEAPEKSPKKAKKSEAIGTPKTAEKPKATPAKSSTKSSEPKLKKDGTEKKKPGRPAKIKENGDATPGKDTNSPKKKPGRPKKSDTVKEAPMEVDEQAGGQVAEDKPETEPEEKLTPLPEEASASVEAVTKEGLLDDKEYEAKKAKDSVDPAIVGGMTEPRDAEAET